MADEHASVKRENKEENTVEKRIVKKYLRGHDVKLKGLKDKKLKGKLQKSELKSREAAQQAARSELLLTEEAGYLEAEGLEKTYHYKQHDIAKAVDVTSASNYFELKLENFAPYSINYTRDGSNLLLGGRKGHLTTLDWKEKRLGCEFHVQETIRDVRWLHIETMFAVAQKKCVYIYDNSGLELHCLENHDQVNRLEFLPYHFLLATVGQKGILKYQDVSTGKPIASCRTGLGPCDCMIQNPYNAIINLGHCRGTVSLWSPNVKDPLVKMLCHRGPVKAIAVDQGGWYMATAGLDTQLKIWDIRTYKQLQSYKMVRPATTLSISQRGLLAAGCGPHVQIWRDAYRIKQQRPYMSNLFPSTAVQSVQFCPYEDVLGVGHSKGFSSLLIPGAGEPNFDALEANPYHTKKQRQEFEVKALLDKIQPDLIAINPHNINKVQKKNTNETAEEKEELGFQPKHKKKGRSSAANQFRRKKGVTAEDRKDKIKEGIREKQKKARAKKIEEKRTPEYTTALDRFKKKIKSD